jgi:hypothetical protein
MSSDKSNGYRYHEHKAIIGDDELIDVLRAADECDRSLFASRQLVPFCDYNAKQVGRRLSKLEERNVVERHGSQTPYKWRLVD